MLTGLDWLNPMLVRRHQQIMRSKSFVTLYHLLLAGQLVVALVFCGSAGGPGEAVIHSGSGPKYLYWVICLLGATVAVLVPLTGWHQTQIEAQPATLDLVVITHLTPWRIAWGWYTAQMIQVVLFASLMTPFLVFAYLFRGVRWLEVLGLLSWIALVAAGTNAVALFFGSFRRLVWPDRIALGVLSLVILIFITIFVANLTVPMFGPVVATWTSGTAFVLTCLLMLATNLTPPRTIPPPPPGKEEIW